MAFILTIALIFGAISIVFILKEIHDFIEGAKVLWPKLKWYQKWKVLIAGQTLFVDLAITLGVAWLFMFSGMIGMVVSLMSSGVASCYLWYRKRKYVKAI